MDFEQWYLLNNLSYKDIPDKLGSGFVYILRNHASKEVLYIGSTKNICLRIFGNYIGSAGGSTTQRIHAILVDEGAIKNTEVAWKETINYRLEEKHLLEAHRKETGRLPLWNKRM